MTSLGRTIPSSEFTFSRGSTPPASWLRYALIVIIIVVVTIFIVLLLANQFALFSSNTSTFTYGDTVTIRSLATGAYLAPGCSFTKNGGTALVGDGATVSVVTADGTADVAGDITKWTIIAAPPNATSQGYAFQNNLTKQYLVVPFFSIGAANSTLLYAISAGGLVPPLVPTAHSSSVDATVLYEVSQTTGGAFLFRPQTPTFASSTSTGSLGVFTITHTDQNGILSILATVGAPNENPPSAPTTCNGGIPGTSITLTTGCAIQGECVSCPTSTPACVRLVPISFATSTNFSREQFLFKITKVS